MLFPIQTAHWLTTGINTELWHVWYTCTLIYGLYKVSVWVMKKFGRMVTAIMLWDFTTPLFLAANVYRKLNYHFHQKESQLPRALGVEIGGGGGLDLKHLWQEHDPVGITKNTVRPWQQIQVTTVSASWILRYIHGQLWFTSHMWFGRGHQRWLLCR